MATRRVHLAANFCFIPANLNKEISNKAPSVYFAKYQKENPTFQQAVDTHLIPTQPDSPIWRDDYDAFISQRSALIATSLNKFLESGPYTKEEPGFSFEDKEAETVKFIEVALRDMIDDRLTAVAGTHYWKETIPGDVKNNTKERIAAHLARHPYQGWSDFPMGRARLDHCDVADYEKIVFKNWSAFSEIFGRKDMFSQHMASFREFRNTVAHNYEANDVQRKLGEAAIIWLENVINAYSNPSDVDEEINTDNE